MMKKLQPSFALAGIVLFSFILIAAQSVSTASADDNSAVRRVLSGIVAADNAGDLDAVITHYADDAILLPPNEALVVGKFAIRARYEDGFRRFRFDITFGADETQIFSDWAFLRGTIDGRIVPKGNEPVRKLHDKYIMVLHRQKDGWKIARLIWHGSEP